MSTKKNREIAKIMPFPSPFLRGWALVHLTIHLSSDFIVKSLTNTCSEFSNDYCLIKTKAFRFLHLLP